ncbi:transmembrane protein 14C-like [Engraulis encrasicolus]|uniref:transmembrane protein 14C-like n=1 Tax=Engraulis encrasicolus TaxID=184585 RepID=UPI002FD17160
MESDLVGYAYAVLVASGGVIGFVRAGSVASLFAGLLFGAAAWMGAYRRSQNSQNYRLSLGTSAVLAAVMGFRFLNSGKFMPAGLVAAASVLMLVRLCVSLLRKRHPDTTKQS